MASYPRNKARKSTSPFLSFNKGALKSPHFRSLSGNETKVFIHLYGEYNGSNNGYLALPYNRADKELHISRQLLSKTLKQLEEKGWIEKSRQGGKGRLSYYAVTIEPVDEVIKNGVSVHDLRPTKTASHKWRNCLAK
jgi:hypothetical protein